MKNYYTIRPNLTVAGLALLLAGCASEPAPVIVQAPAPVLSGEQMLSESQRLASLGDRWKKGKELVDRGNNLVREGRSKMDEGNRMIQDGEKIQRESEESSSGLNK
jgi:uncharacterized lipoprotein YajG